MFKLAKKKEKANSDKATLRLVVIFVSRYFNILVLALIFIIAAAGYFYILRPKYNEITMDIEKAMASREEEKSMMERYLGRLETYRRNFELVKNSDREKIDAILPEQGEAEDLFLQLSYLIQGRGLLLDGITITPEDEGGKNSKSNIAGMDKIGSIKANLKISGADYKAFKNLLKTVENNLRLMDIKSVSFSPGGKSVNMELVAYYLKS